MTETFSIDIEIPEFMRLIDAEARKAMFDEIKVKIHDQVAELFESTAKEIIAQKMNFYPFELSDKKTVKTESSEGQIEVKSELSREILSQSGEEALQTLKIALAKGEIDGDTYEELKKLIKPQNAAQSSPRTVCPQCGKRLEPMANFCRFCGAKTG